MEDERTSNPSPDNTDQGLARFSKGALPAYYSIKIDCFSRLVDLKIEKYESATFHASDFSWRLILYPNGNTNESGEGHISLYLAIDKTDTLPLGWEVYVRFKMFVFNPHKNKYLTIPDDSLLEIRRFHHAKRESGYDRLISLDTFNAAKNGYLSYDSCVFGVEVYEVKYTGNGEALKMIDDPQEVTFNWKIRLNSAYCKELYSLEFTGGKHKWRLRLNPYEDCESNDKPSLYLELAESPSTVKKVLAEYSLLLKNWHSQYKEETSGYKWFSTTELAADVSSRWGFSEFQLRDYKVYNINDTILVQAKVKIKAEVTLFS